MQADDALLEPLNGYNNKYKNEFVQNAYKYFDEFYSLI